MSDLVLARESAYAVSRGVALFRGVMIPLFCGGALHPVRPIGTELAAEIAALPHPWLGQTDAEQAGADVARVRFARGLFPLDALPPPGHEEWQLAAAFNDLVQLVNPELRSRFRKNVPRLAVSLKRSIAAIAPPKSLADSVVRAALFGGLSAATRRDVHVQWWTGSADYFGMRPPARITAWPDLRRVRQTETATSMWDLAGIPDAPRDEYLARLGELLACSPLTDLACIARTEPPFRWTRALASLVASPAGARLANRALAPHTERPTESLMHKALDAIPKDTPGHAAISAFLSDRRVMAAQIL